MFNNLRFETFDPESFNPSLDMFGSFLKVSIGCPFFIKSTGEVGDFDELRQRWNQTLIEYFCDEVFTFLNVITFWLHFGFVILKDISNKKNYSNIKTKNNASYFVHCHSLITIV